MNGRTDATRRDISQRTVLYLSVTDSKVANPLLPLNKLTDIKVEFTNLSNTDLGELFIQEDS